ncbi:hypothetical protein [Cohnella sp. JJ-181]|uniref:hypothetical protein n=1 Tax=Cohnella rhizoplanae TaxID=2974897 RepID=UPI0022FFADA0|nr:hypothetical protein [Cohnella sp. JJ-181]CAI6073674.1 hypothetical protein COHCIP112018_02395 [Cohnella sp. JJ-181]
MQLQRAYQIVDTNVIALTDTAQDIAINGRVCLITNAGAQPAYIRPKAQGAATASTGFMLAAGQALPIFVSVDGTLSAISDATGTSLSILFLDV